MGIDIINGPSFNWAAWEYCFTVGRAFGWQPEGTLAPEDWPPANGPWNGSYFTNDLQAVSATDAKAWAAALDQAVAALRGELPMSDEQRSVLAGPAENQLPGEREITLLLRLADRARQDWLIIY